MTPTLTPTPTRPHRSIDPQTHRPTDPRNRHLRGVTMEEKRRLRAGGTTGSGGPAAGTAGILELPDDVMVCILQHVEDDKTLLVVIPSVGEPGQPRPVPMDSLVL